MRYTQGFNPVPKASFSPALPVGTESLTEYLDIDLIEVILDKNEFLDSINAQLPAGIVIQTVADVPDKKVNVAAKNLTCYQISLARDISGEDKEKLKSFMDCESFTIKKFRKGKQRVIDVRKQVKSFVITGDKNIKMVLLSEEGKSAGKPAEILKVIFNLTDEESLDMSILKVWCKSTL